MGRRRVGIVISGGGSNMMALAAAMRAPDYPAEVAVVISNRPEAAGLERARALGVEAVSVDHRLFQHREDFEAAMQTVLLAEGVEIVCLAGFMRLLTPWFISRWHDRLLNIHPALLPSYKGLHTHARALADGVKIHGATVHFVRPEMDVGPIIVQGAVPVQSQDTEADLAARVLAVEHRLYPLALALVASGRTRVVRHATGAEVVDIAGDGGVAGSLLSL